VRRLAVALAAVVAFLAAGCSADAPLPEVKVHASVSPLAAQALVTLAVNRRVARVVLVPDPAGADLAWFADPVQALRSEPLLVPGSAPDARGVERRWKDPRGRFFPVGAHANVFLVNPRSSLPFPPAHLRDLADPRLAGLQAMVPLGRGDGPATVAALAVLSSEEAALRLAAAIGAQRPQLAPDGSAVRSLVASGKAAFGLAGSEDGAAGAVSSAALEVVFPDRGGLGTLVFPTAAAILTQGVAKPAARALADWLSGPDAEQLLVARAPGLMPLRADVPLPPSVKSARDLRSPALDWDALAEMDRRLETHLGRWPAP
jgi:iron(III) transport system substrate-binding protein